MLEWNQHKEVLYGLYVKENKTIKETKGHMMRSYGFEATSAKYTLQFKKWKWQKNMKKSDWVYVSQQLDRRGQKESAVYHGEVMISASKVRKNISRYVHPNDAFKLDTPPPSPGYITVCTPRPLDPNFETHTSHTSTDVAILQDGPIQDSSSSKRKQAVGANALKFPKTHSVVFSNGKIWRNLFYVLGKVDLTGLPYYQLRDILGSEDVKKGFREIVTWNDSCHGNVIHHFWPESPSTTPDGFVLHSPYSFGDVDTDDPWSMIYQHPSPKPKPFGFSLLFNNLSSVNDFMTGNNLTLNLKPLLSNIPLVDESEIQVLEKLLLGPPTVKAARRFIEVGIYLISNHLAPKWQFEPFIETMLQSIPWRPVLRGILSMQLPSIQSLSERVFLYAIATNRYMIVEDLLRQEPIRTAVASSGSALIAAVRTSNHKLVSLVLDAGARPNAVSTVPFGFSLLVPLTEAKNVQITRLLLNSGANINSRTGSCVMEPPQYYLHAMPAIVAAAVRKNTDLVRYLIESGADVNLQANIPMLDQGAIGISAAMVAVQHGMIEILQMLLQAKARPNELSRTDLGFALRLDEKMTPIQKAASMGDLDSVRLLVKYGGDVNAPASSLRGMTALQAAVSRADIKMTRLLIAHGGNVNASEKCDNQFPCSLLTTAVEMNNLDIVKTLLEAGAHVNGPSFGFHGCTVLESALHLPCISTILDLLVASGAQLGMQSKNEYRQVQLRSAVIAGDFARIRTVLGTGLKIYMAPFYAESPYENESDRSLGPSKSNFGVLGSKPKSILEHAMRLESDAFRILFEVVQTHSDQIDLYPLLLEAIRAKSVKVQMILLDAGADINTAHCHARKLIGTPLMLAAYLNDLEAVRFLCKNGADVNVVVKRFDLDGEGTAATTALQISLWGHWRAQHNDLDVFHFLRNLGATLNAPVTGYGGLSELSRAVKIGDIAIVKMLLDSGAEINSPPATHGGATALQVAAGHHDRYWVFPSVNIHTAIVKLLLQRGADVNAAIAKNSGMTALGAAAKRGHCQVALMLLKAGADVNAESTFDSNQRTPLQWAALEGRIDTVHLLLKAGADLHLPESERHIDAASDARSKGFIAIATILENWKVDGDMESSLHTAISLSQGNVRVVELD